jgi:hypothetical protein
MKTPGFVVVRNQVLHAATTQRAVATFAPPTGNVEMVDVKVRFAGQLAVTWTLTIAHPDANVFLYLSLVIAAANGHSGLCDH